MKRRSSWTSSWLQQTMPLARKGWHPSMECVGACVRESSLGSFPFPHNGGPAPFLLHTGGARAPWAPLVPTPGKHLNLAETKYGAFKSELLALYLAIQHSRYLLDGWTFIHIWTIHVSTSPFAHWSYQINGHVINSGTLLTLRSSPPIAIMHRASKIMSQMHCPE